MADKIESLLPILYKDMHAKGEFAGDTWREYLPRLQAFAAAHPGRDFPVLDYGCGPKGGLAAEYGAWRVISHDPFVPEYAADPWGKSPATFFSADVFEHMTVDALRRLMSKICACRTLDRIFVAISTRSANKTMPNGMNAHLTVRHAQWWRGFFDARLAIHFEPVLTEYDLLKESAVFGFVRKPEEPE